MEDLTKVLGSRPTTPFMSWHVIGRDGVSERRIGPKREKTAAEIGANPDGAMFVGDSIRLEVVPPFPGYIQFWNLGTSGTVAFLGQFPIDGECHPFTSRIKPDSPTTAETGRNDILIGVVTKMPVEIDPEAMGAARSTVSTRGGFSSVEEVKTVSLSGLSESDWAWCILETEVKR